MTHVDHEREAEKAEYYMDTNDFRAGKYAVRDVSKDPTWHDVKCVERHFNRKGDFTTHVNHREKDYATVCASLEAQGATKTA